jgi:hypothetical protein
LGETTSQIEMHIRDTREDLSANLNELQHKVRSAIDWRQHYERHTGAFLGAALGAGLLLSFMGRRRRKRPADD